MQRHLRNVDGEVIASITNDVPTAAAWLRGWLDQGGSLHGADGPADLAGMDFREADLSECHAAGLVFAGCDFSLANLRSGNFRGCDLSGVLMAGTILDAANLHGARLAGSRLVPWDRPGTTGRHQLRPSHDEFLPWDRVLARCTDFEAADLSQAVIISADLTAASLVSARLAGTILQRCCLEGAIMTQACLDGAMVLRCSLVTASLCQLASAQGAVFRTCEYLEVPVPSTIAEASWRFPAQARRYVIEERQRWRRLAREIRLDYARQLATRAVVLGSVPLLALLAWRHVETNALLGLITAAGAATTFALRRYFTMMLQSLVGWLLGWANDAEGLWRSGLRGRSFVRAALRGRVDQAGQDR